MKTICVGRGGGILILERYGLHDVHSHDEDCSKYFKYDQIISVSEAAITIRKNMLLHDSPSKTIAPEHHRSVMRRVRHARKDLTAKQLGGFIIADNFKFGSLTEFSNRSMWSEAVRKHKDPAMDFHVSLYDYVVIGYELIAERDVARIYLSSVWMLANALRAIIRFITGWSF